MPNAEQLVYTIQDIKILRKCGKDAAYAIAKGLPHYKDGKAIKVIKEDFDRDFEKIKEEAQKNFKEKDKKSSNANIYQIRKPS